MVDKARERSSLLQGCYLCTFGIENGERPPSGVETKIAAQIDAFNDAGLQCRFLECVAPSSRLRRGLGSLPFISDGIKWPDLEQLGKLDFLYIRRPLYSSKEFLRFLAKARSANPGIKIVVEIPTYPYDKELSSPVTFFALRKERKYRQYWKKFVDGIADFSQHDEIFGIPTLPIRNGVNLKSISPRLPHGDSRDAIEGIFAASFGPWHGADLLIEGLYRYYEKGGKRDIVIHLAGGGSLIDELSSQVNTRGLERHVLIHGPLSRSELDCLYDKCTIAFDSLALHRRGQECLLSSSLKSREYLAKGIPSVYAGTIDLFKDEKPDFTLELPSEEKPLDFQKVVDFHDALYKKEAEEDLILRIRHYAEEWASMEASMESVIDFFQDDKDA